MNLLYIPYAGSSAMLCRSWKSYLNPDISIQPLELAGRGTRMKEGFYQNMEEAVDDLYLSLFLYCDSPYAVYGHSLGAVLTFELYYKILKEGIRLPEHLFFSGSRAPFAYAGDAAIDRLPDAKLIDKIAEFQGMEPEILGSPELASLFLPILRADFRLLAGYRYQAKEIKIETPVSVLYGNDLSWEQVLEWRSLTADDIQYQAIDGSHFFIKERTQEVLDFVKKQLY